MTSIVSGFPGVGKSHFAREWPGRVSDSDSSQWSWAAPKVRHPRWPGNYLEHVQQLWEAGQHDFILVSSHAEVRAGLVEIGLPFLLVYPSLEMKAEYIQRYRDRGSSEGFIQLLEAQYETWVRELDQQVGCQRRVLQAGQYLADVVRT